MTLTPRTRLGPYELTALIGEGGMGKVWRAHHTALKRDDALKVLPDAFASDPDRLARFRREAQVLASLNHPNIAHVYGLEQAADGVQALVMELVEGPTLAERIAQGPIPVDETLPIARQIAEALEAAHEQWLLEWLESAKGRLRAASYTRYKGIIEQTILKSPIAAIPLQRLRPTHLENYYTNATVSASTLTLHHAILHRALRKAVRDRLIAVNPARDLEGRPKRSHSRDDARKHAWNVTEVQRFLDAANQAGEQAAAFYTLALDSGMRKGELCGLKWEDVDLEGGRLRVVRQLLAASLRHEAGDTGLGALALGPTKTGKVRTITLSAETVGLLQEHRRVQREEMMRHRDDWKDFGLVFTRDRGLPVLMNNLGQREYAQLIEAAKVKAIKFHGLRHTCATLLLQAGTPVHVVSERLGHSKVSMTMEVYAHVLPDMQRDAATTMGTLLRGNR